MTKFAIRALAAVAALLFLTSCGSDGGGQQSVTLNYKEMKDMVVDILKTEDGRKAISESMVAQGQTGQIKLLQSGSDGLQLQMAVKEVMSDPAYAQTLKELMIDPTFAGDFAKSIQTEIKAIQKDLLKDPKYREALIETFKDPQYQKMIMETMKTSEHRQLIMTVMTESLESPLYRAEMIKLMKKALDEQMKEKSPSKAAAESGGEKSGGENGGE
jgi:spore germination protein D